jgi:predicted nucleic acid-binding protein
MRVYLDTNAFIPAVEGQGPLHDAMERLFGIGDDRTGLLVTSELTLAELLVAPLARKQDKVVATYLELIDPRPGLDVMPISRRIIILAAQKRAADKSLKLPDALHLATAEAANCSYLLSGDRGIKPLVPLRRIAMTAQDINQLIDELT